MPHVGALEGAASLFTNEFATTCASDQITIGPPNHITRMDAEAQAEVIDYIARLEKS